MTPITMDHIALFLKDIHAGRKNGRLTARTDGWERTLAFQDGGLIFAKTSLPEERLGTILLNMGRITSQDAEMIPSLMSAERMLGETLMAKRLISQKDLYEALLAQMSKISLALFSVFDARLQFAESERIVDVDFEMKMYVPQIIELGIREMEYPPALIEFLGPQFPAAGGTGSTRTLGTDEKELLASLDGSRSVQEIMASTAMEPKHFWRTIYLFYCLDLADFRKPGPEPASVPASGPEASAASEAPSETAVSADLRAAIEEVLAFHQRLPRLDYYQILEVGRTTGDEDIKKAYFRLARKFHPDRFGRQADAEVRDKIEAVFDAVSKAYRTLSRKDQRAMYDSKSAGPAPTDDKDRGRNAEIRFRQGKTLFSQGRYEEAAVLLDEAVHLKDDKGDYFLLLAMAESKIPDLGRRAEHDFLRAIEIEPWNPEAHVGLGYLYKREGLTLRARKQFEKALEIDSDHKAARQGLDETGSKAEGKKNIKGLLGKDLFGGKKK
ncbi:MAG: J domain-containing protein [Acidobacteriota bacterium]|nr:J domain-containing protein [Acidobacteriota bacterium]